MPIAYMYLSILDSSKKVRNSQRNLIKTQVEVLRIFFTSLRQEGLQPVFVLTDKDADEIALAEEAWLLIPNIQLCYWHLEHAIDRKIKDKKYKSSTYSATKVLEAHHKFEFIDPS